MILIIDDDIAVRTSLHLLLQSEGYTTLDAAAPEEAMETVQ
ncbi:MAG: two-component system response regulator KdpE, partial [Flavisolibacter sp.]|nr:two-component system response regulator KdpE [Flavisolibacter sp.]